MKLANKDNSLSFRSLDCLVLWIFTEASINVGILVGYIVKYIELILLYIARVMPSNFVTLFVTVYKIE